VDLVLICIADLFLEKSTMYDKFCPERKVPYKKPNKVRVLVKITQFFLLTHYMELRLFLEHVVQYN
jgi:hypothetical protein